MPTTKTNNKTSAKEEPKAYSDPFEAPLIDYEDESAWRHVDALYESDTTGEKLEGDGLTIKSQVPGWADWSTASIKNPSAREAAEWLIKSGLENEKDVKGAFYDRQTTSMSDDFHAEENDDLRIVPYI